MFAYDYYTIIYDGYTLLYDEYTLCYVEYMIIYFLYPIIGVKVGKFGCTTNLTNCEFCLDNIQSE